MFFLEGKKASKKLYTVIQKYRGFLYEEKEEEEKQKER
jgi:hypothetical protein